MIDVSDLTSFEARMNAAATIVESEADDWASHWGDETARLMEDTAPQLTGALARSIRQVKPGEIEIGVDYWPYVVHGTSRMPPQDFIGPSVNRIRPRALDDAAARALRLISR